MHVPNAAYSLLVLVLSAATYSAESNPNRPSFACRSDAPRVEVMICDDPLLAAFDQELASLYRARKQMHDSTQRTALVAAQRAWIGSRDNCHDVKCLRESYQQRINDLLAPPLPKGVPVPSSAHMAGLLSGQWETNLPVAHPSAWISNDTVTLPDEDADYRVLQVRPQQNPGVPEPLYVVRLELTGARGLRVFVDAIVLQGDVFDGMVSGVTWNECNDESALDNLNGGCRTLLLETARTNDE